jgi:hypothetical protein
MSAIKTYLQSKVGISYTSDAWIITHCASTKRRSIRCSSERPLAGGAALGLCQNISTYEQKRHLYVTQKIRTANGVFDLMRNSVESGLPAIPSVYC